MRSLKALAVFLSAVSAFSLQSPNQSNPATAVTQPGIPVISFSDIGTVASVQMTGTVSSTFGADQQAGTVTLQANANGQSQLSMQMPDGPRVETQNAFSEVQRQCTWSGVEAVVHKSAVHHCWLDTVWFLPQITMQAGTGAADDVVSLPQPAVGNTVRLHHERHLVAASVGDDQTGQLIAHLSSVDLDLDAATSLPSTLYFSIHPDSNAGLDIPVEVHYSAYQTFTGVIVPTHIQKFINHSLVLDLQITGAQIQLAAPATPSSLQ